MKNFVKGMDKTGHGFEYLRNKFPNESGAKLKERIYVQDPRSGNWCKVNTSIKS